MNWTTIPIVAFDTETTGLEPFAGDRVIEFAAVIFHMDETGHIKSRDDHSWLINPGIEIPKMVTQLTGINNSDVTDAPSFEEVAGTIRDILTQGITVAHNYPFDLAFLREEFGRVGLSWPNPIAEVDTVDLSIKHFSEAKHHRLADLCKRLDVSLEGAHRATNDAAACGQCFIEMAKRHNVSNELQAMLDWASAIGRPPEDAPFERHENGRLIFRESPHQGEYIVEHPIHLAWMERARTHEHGKWGYVYSDHTRAWICRWLNARSSGRARTNAKSFRSEDWVLDSCITLHN
jgi:DNA polymerase III epsilon subunit family exonuclease